MLPLFYVKRSLTYTTHLPSGERLEPSTKPGSEVIWVTVNSLGLAADPGRPVPEGERTRRLNSEPEPIASFRANAPPELQRIIRKCLEKDREKRYVSARELHTELLQLKELGGFRELGQPGVPAGVGPTPTQDRIGWRALCHSIPARRISDQA